jgi:hypothetical protein
MLIEIWKDINPHFTGLKPPFSQATSPQKHRFPSENSSFFRFFSHFFLGTSVIFPVSRPFSPGRSLDFLVALSEVVTDQRFAFVAMDLSMAPTRGLQLGFGKSVVVGSGYDWMSDWWFGT